MLITIIIASALMSLICLLLIRQHYQEQLALYRDAWQRQRQTIFFQFQRIEELEIEKETLHQVAVRALAVPDVEEYHEAGGLEIAVWRN